MRNWRASKNRGGKEIIHRHKIDHKASLAFASKGILQPAKQNIKISDHISSDIINVENLMNIDPLEAIEQLDFIATAPGKHINKINTLCDQLVKIIENEDRKDESMNSALKKLLKTLGRTEIIRPLQTVELVVK